MIHIYHNMINIRMLKICGKSICKPFELIFNECMHGRQNEFIVGGG